MASFKDSPIGIIVNDFGKINVDYRLVEQEGMTMAEVSNGSIFCACVKDKFVDSLVEMAKHPLERLFIEASGLADPSNIQSILDGIAHKTGNVYHYSQAICVVDGENYLKMSGLLPALERQVKHSGIVLINKADLIDKDTQERVMEKVKSLNEDANVLVTTHCQFDYKRYVNPAVARAFTEGESLNTPENKPPTLTLVADTPLNRMGLEAFLEEVIPATYRLKGFVQTDKGNVEVSAVNRRMSIKNYQKPLNKTELIAISSTGIKLYNVVLKASKTHLDGLLKID